MKSMLVVTMSDVVGLAILGLMLLVLALNGIVHAARHVSRWSHKARGRR